MTYECMIYYLHQEFLGGDYVFGFFPVCLSICVFVCVCQCDKSKNNAWILTKLFSRVETTKISDEFEDGQNPSSSSKVISGYLLILVRISIEIHIKVSIF